MKHHHWILIILAIIIAGALVFLPSISLNEAANEFVGTWHGGGTNTDGEDWWMEYEIKDATYSVTSSGGYEEYGSYTVGERFLDGSVEIHKIYKEGEKKHTMIFLTSEDIDTIYLEGVELSRIKN
jgi:hypothetical protein